MRGDMNGDLDELCSQQYQIRVTDGDKHIVLCLYHPDYSRACQAQDDLSRVYGEAYKVGVYRYSQANRWVQKA